MNSETFSEVAATREQAHAATVRAYSHAQAMLANGESVLISCGPSAEPVGIQQRKFLHGVVLRQISEQARVGGERYAIAIWKEHYRQRFVGDGGFRWESLKIPRWDPVLGRMVQPRRATPRRVRVSSEELGVHDYAKWTNEIIDHAVVELGVEFHFESEDRALLTTRPKARESAARTK